MLNHPRETPLLSIVVTTHNRPVTLKRALDSVASQTEQDFEVLVVDDGSTLEHAAATKALTEQYDSRFTLIRRPAEGVRHGPAFARNEGVAAARGGYVTFLDDDDFWCDDRHLQMASTCLRSHPDIDLWVASQRAVKGDTVIVPIWMPKLSQRALKRPSLGDGAYRVRRSDLLWSEGIGFAHVNISIVRRNLIQEIGGFWGDFGYEEDLNFFLRLVDRARGFAHRPAVVSVNTVRDSSELSGASSLLTDSKELMRIAQCQHALLHCSTPEVRGYARGLLSGCFKKLARQRWDVRDYRTAALLAAQAISAQPSLRWSLITCSALAAAVFSSFRRKS